MVWHFYDFSTLHSQFLKGTKLTKTKTTQQDQARAANSARRRAAAQQLEWPVHADAAARAAAGPARRGGPGAEASGRPSSTDERGPARGSGANGPGAQWRGPSASSGPARQE